MWQMTDANGLPPMLAFSIRSEMIGLSENVWSLKLSNIEAAYVGTPAANAIKLLQVCKYKSVNTSL